jgi:microcystin-dependent protein
MESPCKRPGIYYKETNMDAFVGTIIPVAFDWAPRGWALCDGRLLPVTGNEALFSVLGTAYGGDGKTTFGLPDLCGRTAVGSQGAAPAPVVNVTRGQIVGESKPHATVRGTAHAVVAPNNLPSTQANGTVTGASIGARSTLNATSSGPGAATPAPKAMLSGTGSGNPSGAVYHPAPAAGTTLPSVALGAASVTTTLSGSASVTATIGAGKAIDTPLAITSAPFQDYPMQPSLALNYIICLVGFYPTRP